MFCNSKEKENTSINTVNSCNIVSAPRNKVFNSLSLRCCCYCCCCYWLRIPRYHNPQSFILILMLSSIFLRFSFSFWDSSLSSSFLISLLYVFGCFFHFFLLYFGSILCILFFFWVGGLFFYNDNKNIQFYYEKYHEKYNCKYLD